MAVAGRGAEVKLSEDQQRLVEANLKLAFFFARMYFSRVSCEADQEDLVAASTMGLCEAVVTYDPAKGKLANHAQYHCFKCIREYLQDRLMIHTPRYLLNKKQTGNQYQKYAQASQKVIFAGQQLSRIQARTEYEDEFQDLRERFAEINWGSEQRSIVMGRSVRGDKHSEIAKQLGTTRQRVSEIKKAAIQHFRREARA